MCIMIINLIIFFFFFWITHLTNNICKKSFYLHLNVIKKLGEFRADVKFFRNLSFFLWGGG